MRFSSFRFQKGVTLTEMLVTTIIVGISAGIFYAVFYLNWQSFQQGIARADMGAELSLVVDAIAQDARFSKRADIDLSGKTVTLIAPDDSVIAVYLMNANGELIIQRGAGTPDDIKTYKLDYDNSSFTANGSAVDVSIALKDNILGHIVTLNSTVLVYPRN